MSIYIYHRTNLRVDLRGVLIRRPSVRSGTGPSFLSTGCGNRAWYLHHSAAVCATLKFTSVIYSEKSSHLHSVREWHHFFAPKCIPFESGTTFTSHPANQTIQPRLPAPQPVTQPCCTILGTRDTCIYTSHAIIIQTRPYIYIYIYISKHIDISISISNI